ncbi:similar to Saccharomyces cerevisiae YDR043C NRG1 Transcriptional repressor that recruits the Cyc8p-Tup1p complex to promoters [Maudiozyma saulgeensis]|uniref:Similar to Saccharomyces cerevisiae YDR043C NRG1 Transcriptional repressor that recruits the Cyc8p-Tup1p complex to promoters n=1 Tax=Maudiozyma saulgeensis TaxID=1789683 RepID=A0A1X7R430_9SACH|nr:similar to Saccharomyces cerevisiae YDR043C NRG1 Transcriptional repressor that recruits the Cyc8p-Tup1p complex to promoters [Kazachstania saulgeensis]
MTTNFLQNNSQINPSYLNTMSQNQSSSSSSSSSSYNDKINGRRIYPIDSTNSNLSIATTNVENSMVSTIKNASHVIDVYASNDLERLKGQTLLPSPDLSKIFDTDSLKLLDRNAFKYRENLNSLIYIRNNNGSGSYMEENPRKSQSISLGSLGNPSIKNISMFPPGNQSIVSSNTSSRSSTPFNFTTSATPISQASSISLNERFTKNMHFGSSMQDMSIPRTPIELSTAKGVNNSNNNNTTTPSPVSSISSSKVGKKPYTKKGHKKSKSTTNQVIGSSKDSLEERRKYRCSVCPKGFTTSGHLARHNRIHTGEKNHACPFNNCKQRFSRQDNCLQHYRTHFKNNNGVPRTHEIISYTETSQVNNRPSGMNYYEQQYK